MVLDSPDGEPQHGKLTRVASSICRIPSEDTRLPDRLVAKPMVIRADDRGPDGSALNATW